MYLSTINKQKIKGWNYHKKMHMNLIVLKGKVKFVFLMTEKNQLITKTF